MSIIKCPECGSSISDKATSCPQCGFPLATPKMAPSVGRPGARAPRRESAQTVRVEQRGTNKGLIVVMVVLLLALVGLGAYYVVYSLGDSRESTEQNHEADSEAQRQRLLQEKAYRDSMRRDSIKRAEKLKNTISIGSFVRNSDGSYLVRDTDGIQGTLIKKGFRLTSSNGSTKVYNREEDGSNVMVEVSPDQVRLTFGRPADATKFIATVKGMGYSQFGGNEFYKDNVEQGCGSQVVVNRNVITINSTWQ